MSLSVVDAFLDSAESITPELKPLLLNNILLTGGSSGFAGFYDRFKNEVQSGLENPVKIYHSTDSSLYTLALRDFIDSQSFFKNSIYKKVYEEFGSFALTKMLNL